MSCFDTISSDIQEKSNTAFFQKRLRYYIQGAQLCLSNLLDGSDNLPDETLLELKNLLKKCNDQLSALNLGQQEKVEKDAFQAAKNGLDFVDKVDEGSLKQGLSLSKRTNKSLRKKNLRLKRKIRSLRARIKLLMVGFDEDSKLARAKIEQKGSAQQEKESQNTNQITEKTIKKEGETEESEKSPRKTGTVKKSADRNLEKSSS